MDILNKQLVGKIFSQQDISQFKYSLIQYENDLSKLLLNKFFTSINFCGTSSLLVFTKISNKHYCFTVDRQTLSYNFNKIDYSKVKLDIRNIRLDYDIYQGTILDGILVKTHNKSDLFIISDVYTFRGVNYIKTKLDEKLKMIINYLQENYDEDHLENNIRLTVNKIFPIEKTSYIVNKLLPTIKDLKYRGLCFYPEYSDTKHIFMFNNNSQERQEKHEQTILSNKQDIKEVKENKQEQVKVYNNNSRLENINKTNSPHQQTRYKYINTTGKDIFAILEVKLTNNLDVYKINSVERTVVEGKKIIKRVPLGIAYIPGIETSHKLRTIFKDKGENNNVLMKCKFDDNKSKWIPIDIETSTRYPTFINDIDLDMMELSDSDD